ncbi:hypothetical protein [Heyndrickxia oleronia]|uniref:hypothetical protein n=1 Tax=Heyndrickxia oleronia TaxID=38875 RepID=UPI001C0EA55C|nr:hypothetical protein [Heyndrickxia oleronia]MBU5214376.1 hypothetical protein [Heyndrickxia oleronia]
MNEIEQALLSIKEVYVNIPKRIEELEKRLKYLEHEQQDLLHFIEFAKADGREMSKKYKEAKRMRNERRKVKDELDILNCAKEILAYHRPKEKDVSRILGNVRQVLESQNNRTYNMRVRKDLQEKVNA